MTRKQSARIPDTSLFNALAMDEKTSLIQDFEKLFKKTTDANKIFFEEGTKYIKQLGSSARKGEDVFSHQKNLIQDAVNAFIKLNIQHASNLIDLGLAITKRINEPIDINQDESGASENQPAFVLHASGAAGTTVATEFLLDNNKQEPVLCNLRQSEFKLQQDPGVSVNFNTTFSPQSFELKVGESQKVLIRIAIPPKTPEGIYFSHVLADGFEHSYFTIVVTVTSPPVKPEKQTTRKAKSKKK